MIAHFHVATLSTRNFDFEAYGGTAGEARDALAQGLLRHAKTYKIPDNWWHGMDIEIRKVHLGECFRGPEAI